MPIEARVHLIFFSVVRIVRLFSCNTKEGNKSPFDWFLQGSGCWQHVQYGTLLVSSKHATILGCHISTFPREPHLGQFFVFLHDSNCFGEFVPLEF